jgi:hypothetical protein
MHLDWPIGSNVLDRAPPEMTDEELVPERSSASILTRESPADGDVSVH